LEKARILVWVIPITARIWWGSAEGSITFHVLDLKELGIGKPEIKFIDN
jgi:hypothetical protein